MKLANIVLPFIGLILGILGLVLFNNLDGKYGKLRLVLGIALIVLGFIAVFGAKVIGRYMWWTTWGW